MELLAGLCIIMIAIWSNWLLHGLFDFYYHRYRFEKALKVQENQEMRIDNSKKKYKR